jgi:2-polyprenyl-3-methyl-5-hydroxy-6-metoxy-1,4-benzoquinol methylase
LAIRIGEVTMVGLKAKVKNALPEKWEEKIGHYYSWFHYNEYDTDENWRKKASKGGWQSIYWHNEHYNECFDAEQKKNIKFFLKKYKIESKDPILDIGCGIGRLCIFFSKLGYIDITGVDFAEMIKKAEEENNSKSITYINSPAQHFLIRKKYKFIISSGCFGVIRNRKSMFKAIDNCTKMQKRGGYFLMIDPFHKSNYLSTDRARISAKEVIAFVERKGYTLVEKSGMLFFPVKKMVVNNWDIKKETTVKLFNSGERISCIFSKYIFSDYKILGFKKRI